jgi:GNAT superfamily N-acetyltransferase
MPTAATRQPVGYIEGWYVAEDYRQHGVGKKLLSEAEDWARSQKCVEMASDAIIDNERSQRAHEASATRSWTTACIIGRDYEEVNPSSEAKVPAVRNKLDRPGQRSPESDGI